MASNTRATAAKRQRERALVQRRKDKEARRAERATKPQRTTNGEDPDLAGIRPGPQPLADWQL